MPCTYDSAAERYSECDGRSCNCGPSFDDVLVGTADPVAALPYPIGQAVLAIAHSPMQTARIERLAVIQSRLRRKWQMAIALGDLFTAKVMVRRLHRVTFALWGEKAVSL